MSYDASSSYLMTLGILLSGSKRRKKLVKPVCEKACRDIVWFCILLVVVIWVMHKNLPITELTFTCFFLCLQYGQ